ncbi:MAG: hypothetical protein H6Q00_78 [Holophagaceae bacterium]|nr:hypothetical protein [Holophagaceae bacterium]
MVDVITPLRMHLLQVVAKYPDIRREKLLTVKGAQAADIAYLEQHDLIREREVGCYRISHFGQMALKRGL